MVVDTLRSLVAVPIVADRPARTRFDWGLTWALVIGAVAEGLLRPDLTWRALSILVTVALAFGLLWRRSHPFATAVGVFGVMLVINVSSLILGVMWDGLYSAAVVLVVPYALVRWGAGSHIALGATLMVALYGVSLAQTSPALDEIIGGAIVFAFPAVLAAAVRTRSTAQARRLEQVKATEREGLARELHDTVAHHVSAIVIQAQAGRAVAATSPQAAIDVLATIEEAAARTLDEMRSIVGALRGDDPAQLAPQPGVDDLARLVADGDGPPVAIRVEGDLDGLTSAVDATLFRLAQESITNARRHARNPTGIEVVVRGEGDRVRLTVSDDGDPVAAVPADRGYGLVGMTERAELLGGTVVAGPGVDRGWTVEAVLPTAAVPTP